MVEHYITIVASIISVLSGIILILINYSYDKIAVYTNAEIVSIEEEMKYYDSSYDKRITYNYVYKYYHNGQAYYGKIIKNNSSVENLKGCIIQIKYFKQYPRLSMINNVLFLFWYISMIVVHISSILGAFSKSIRSKFFS